MDSSCNSTESIWKILAAAGMWRALPCEGTPLPLPKEKYICLKGIPLASATNEGENKDLRIINLAASSLNGPVSFTGLQTGFLNNSLRHTVKWEVKPFCEEDLSGLIVGFYASNYITQEIGPNKALPMITNSGPGLFKHSTTGEFTFTTYSDMYLIVNRNVAVDLTISWKEEKQPKRPCFTTLYKPYEYIVDGKVIATEQLTDAKSQETFLRPADPYICKSNKIVKYLTSKALTISLLDDGSISNNFTYTYTNVPFTRIGPRKYVANFTRLKYATENGLAISLPTGTARTLTASLKIKHVVGVSPFTVQNSRGDSLDKINQPFTSGLNAPNPLESTFTFTVDNSNNFTIVVKTVTEEQSEVIIAPLLNITQGQDSVKPL